MAFAEDLTPFFNTNDFAVAALWNGTTTVNGIHDPRYVDPFNVEGIDDVFLCPIASAPTVKQGDTLVVNGTTYKVRNVRRHEPDPDVMLLKLETQ